MLWVRFWGISCMRMRLAVVSRLEGVSLELKEYWYCRSYFRTSEHVELRDDSTNASTPPVYSYRTNYTHARIEAPLLGSTILIKYISEYRRCLMLVTVVRSTIKGTRT